MQVKNKKVNQKDAGEGSKKGKKRQSKAALRDDDSHSDGQVKVKKARRKGKGKATMGKDDENPSREEKKKKVVLAQEVYWEDIPVWEEGSGSMLMEMPSDVMDKIFGVREELGVSHLHRIIATREE
jgi:hypothetical protein